MIKLRLKEFLRERGITQRQLALITGLSRSTIGKYANSHAFPNDKNLKAISNVLDIPVSRLLISDNSKGIKGSLSGEFTQVLDVHFLGPALSHRAVQYGGNDAGVYPIEYVGQITIKPGSLVIFNPDLSRPISINSDNVFGFSFDQLIGEFELVYECTYNRNELGNLVWEVLQRQPFLSYHSTRWFYSLTEVFASIRVSYMEYVANRNSPDFSIEFSPEHKQAGVQILNYFQETLNQKYPDEEVTVRLSQKGNTVAMEIQTPDGKTEKYEKAFADYELVITGKKDVEEYLANPADQLALKFELKNAHTRLEMQRDLMLMKDQIIAVQGLALDTKEARISYFEGELSKSLSGSRTHTTKALDIASQALASDEDVKKLVATFEADLKDGNEEQVKAQVASLEKEKPGILKRLLNFGSTAATKAGEKVLTSKLQEIIETVSDGSALPPA